MAHEQWRERLDESEAAYMPLILNCILAVVILTAIRDPIIIDVVPITLILINGVAITLLAAMVAWSLWGKLPAARSSQFVLMALSILAVKSIALVYIEHEPLPLLMAVMIFGFSLCFLSQKYLLGAVSAFTLAWTAVALLNLSLMQVIPTLLAMIIAFFLGLFVLERRIRSLEHVFTLEKKLSNLEKILPMCASCKKTRDEQGEWKTIEEYIEEQKGLQVSHGVCPGCAKKLYGNYINRGFGEAPA